MHDARAAHAGSLTVHHLALGAWDVERVAAFYASVFQLPELRRHHTPEGALRAVWLGLGEGVLMIEHAESTRAPVNGVGAGLFLLAFAVPVEARTAWEEKLEAAGAIIESRTSHTSYARDPEGNRVAVSSYPLA